MNQVDVFRDSSCSMVFQLNRLVPLLLLVAVAITTWVVGDSRAIAQEAPVEFVEFGMDSQFPEGITFHGTVNSSVEVEDIRVTYEVGDRNITQYNYLDLEYTGSDPVVITGELFVNTNSPDRYIPPGSVIKYQLEVLAANGESYESGFGETLLLDARFEWDSVTRGPVTVYYHGPVQSRAETLAEKTSEGLIVMAPVTGAEIETPIAIMLYNNNAEMIKAVVPRSATISRELITEGQAFGEENTVLVLAGRSDIGTATHEITHVLVGRASNGATLVPFWLNEGLAEFGNLDKTVSYTRYLEWAVGTGRLPTLRSLNRAPGDPNLTLVGYGSGRSAVNFMVTEFGAEKMAALLAALGAGIPIQDAIPVAYGMSFDELENLWRTSIGADLYVAPTVTPTSSVPTATPTPGALLPLTLDDIAAAGQATATPEVQPTPDESTAVADATDTPSAAGTRGGGSCNAVGNNGPAQATPVLGISALLMIGTWRSLRRLRHSTDQINKSF
jgi:hypothetical protein